MPLLQMPITDACDQIWPSGKREAARDEHSSSEHRDLDMSLYALLDHTIRWARPLSCAVRAIFCAARGIFSISKSNTSKFTRGVITTSSNRILDLNLDLYRTFKYSWYFSSTWISIQQGTHAESQIAGWRSRAHRCQLLPHNWSL